MPIVKEMQAKFLHSSEQIKMKKQILANRWPEKLSS